MGQKSQFQVHSKQAQKRKKARKKLIAKGENIAQYYYGKYYLKPGEDK